MKIDKKIEDYQADAMLSTWIDFCRDKNVDQEEGMGRHMIAREWMLYVVSHYKEPMAPIVTTWE